MSFLLTLSLFVVVIMVIILKVGNLFLKKKFMMIYISLGHHPYIPLAINTFSGWHLLALQTIGRIALQLARATDSELGMVRRHLRQRLAIYFVRDNVAMLGTHVSSFAPQELDGDTNSG